MRAIDRSDALRRSIFGQIRPSARLSTLGDGNSSAGVTVTPAAMGKPSSGKEDSQTTTTKLQGKGNVASLAEKLAAGVQKHLSTLAQVIIGSSTFTPAQVAAQLLAFAKLRNDVDTARAALKAKLVDEKAQGPALREFFLAVLQFVRAAFGNSPDILVDFGLAAKPGRTPQTVEQKAAAAAKGHAMSCLGAFD